MATLSSLLPATNGATIGVLLTLALGAFLLTRDAFWWTDVSYRFPFFGKLARFSNDYSESRRGGWLNVEITLCRDYAMHVTSLSKEQFANDREYLRKAFDHGRRPMPNAVRALIAFLVIGEGFGFSYVLSGLMALDSSENLRQVLTIVIVVVLATILLWVTHSAGHQLYRTRLLRSCFRQFQAHAILPAGKREQGNTYISHIVSLGDCQSADDGEPTHVQCANRVVSHPADRGSYAWVWIAAVLVAVIAIGSVILRIETMNSMAEDGAATSAEQIAALTGFSLLATIFVVTQLVGMGVGYWYGFAGRESKEAYRETAGHADFEAFFRQARHRMNIADLRLANLHQRMERSLPQEVEWSRDFYAFIEEERARGITDIQDPRTLDPCAPKMYGGAKPIGGMIEVPKADPVNIAERGRA